MLSVRVLNLCVIPSVIEGSHAVCVDSKMIIFIELNNLSPRFFDCTAFRSEWHDQCHSVYSFCHPECNRGISDYACWLWLKHCLIKSDQSTAKRDFAFGREKRIRLQVSWFSSKKIALKVVMSDGLRCFNFANMT